VISNSPEFYIFYKAGAHERQALWADLIHKFNIDFLKKQLNAKINIYPLVLKGFLSVISFNNCKRSRLGFSA